MKRRVIFLRIDDIAAMLKDYMGESDMPTDAKPVQLMFHPAQQGKLCLVMNSSAWTPNMSPLTVKFHLRKIYGVS